MDRPANPTPKNAPEQNRGDGTQEESHSEQSQAELFPPGAVAPPELELSIVIPCLDEAETLGTCVAKARSFLDRHALRGEVIVADNGSRDGSAEIARRRGARVVQIPAKGYGSALRGGIEQARGRYIVMGDGDDSYDFSQLSPFLERLRAGDDLVMGNRFQGGVEEGAMPWLHRYIGNPLLSALGRLFFRSPVRDFHCGLRAFSKASYDRMGLRSTGMEFASEMVIKATLLGLTISEVPTILHKDGRSRPPHLRTWRDGWRHLRFMLLFSPRWLFLVPGTLLLATGTSVSLWLMLGGGQVGDVVFDIHTLLIAGLACLLGYQLIVFAVFSKVFAVTEGFQPMPPVLDRLFAWITLETGLLAGLGLTLVGLLALGIGVYNWSEVGFGELDPRVTMRQVIPGSVLVVLGIQTVFSSFFLSILGLRRG